MTKHVHTREDEISRVIWAEIDLMIDGEVTVLKAGDTAFAPKNFNVYIHTARSLPQVLLLF